MQPASHSSQKVPVGEYTARDAGVVLSSVLVCVSFLRVCLCDDCGYGAGLEFESDFGFGFVILILIGRSEMKS